MPQRPRTTQPLTPQALGAAINRMAARVRALNDERATLLKDFAALTQAVQALADDLGIDTVPEVRPRGRPKGYKMSEATRAKLRAAWKRRKRRMASGEGGGSGTTN